MRRLMWLTGIVVCLAATLVGCGKRDVESVVKQLDSRVEQMVSYQGTGQMILHTGQEPQEYQVEVWYQTPKYYRIALNNEKKDISQIVLRNDDGVFVLTPHLNKSFRFQSEWPDNQGQVYLFQSLVQSVVEDKDRQFTTEDQSYVFDVVANYQNASLARQKIWFDQKTFAPQHVEVSDANANVVVAFDFAQFEFGKKFDKDSFDMQRNMTSWNLNTLPTMAQNAAANENSAANDKGAAAVPDSADSTTKKVVTMPIIESTYLPQGVKMEEMTETTLDGSKAILLRYSGTFHYSLLESWPTEQTASSLAGEIIDLGYTLGVLTGEDKRMLTWTYDGVEFRLSSADLPKEEMIKVAMSVSGQSGK